MLLDTFGEATASFDPLLHSTAGATIVQGGEKNNVIPSEITVEIDGRILPGFTADQFLDELRALAGPDVEFGGFDDPNPATAGLRPLRYARRHPARGRSRRAPPSHCSSPP